MKIQELEQSLASKNAIKKEVEDLKEKVRFWKYLNSSLLQLAQSVEDKNLISKGIEVLTENHQTLAHKVLELEKTNEELVNNIIIKDQEIFELKECIIDLFERGEESPKYTPAKVNVIFIWEVNIQQGDAIDGALADYLNNNSEASKYRVLFIRESEGVYQFGSKKIYIKIEGDKVLSIIRNFILGNKNKSVWEEVI